MQNNEQESWFNSAKEGDLKSLQQTLESGFEINSTDQNGNSALHYASQGAHLDVMRFLIEHGADLNLQNSRLSTPLHLTAKNIDAIRILLEAGADPNIQDADWCYPYYFAFYGSMTRELSELYIKHGAKIQYIDKM
ncbi:serine/threonine-protein phosphatase 6 regulatory ankyrin repeat subunit A [Mariprofundus ferrinatatus]|uniref:Serine/threonine-protein phosphatase 6 regulatory ankyrin repeat subunit A n=1 Tax=Mariprofundus ferrinatatus TaxID=1921087 RepID=A0A2K8LC02_9PROT|nr:ankyrin repeat domain-containing protein [Mariprofundus ferrinatatus]ATX81786.1 serine/threonine-protein phosphatase 6 regulatory ankyrin repeat subunit A [Mariprofundus ferrinatatus]